MNERSKNGILKITLTILVSIAVSLVAVWLISEIFSITFSPEIVAVLSAVGAGTAITQDMRKQKAKVRKNLH